MHNKRFLLSASVIALLSATTWAQAPASPSGTTTPSNPPSSGTITSGNSASGTNTTGNSASGKATSDYSASGNTMSGNSSTGITTSGNSPSGRATSGNSSSGNTMTGNSSSGRATSGNSASGNTMSGNSPSGKAMYGDSSRGQSQVGARRDSLSNDSATHGKGLTASDQSNNKGDIDITAKIRREIMATKGMSINAHNVKIVTIDGKVTLKGVVNSASEKESVGQIANSVANSANVTNLLQVK